MRRYGAKLEYLDAISGNWETIDSNTWLGLWACNVPFMSESDWAAPEAEFDNGILDVLVLNKATRLQVLGMFLAMEEGKHIGGTGLTLLKVKAFRFYARERTPKLPGLLDIDGELVPFAPIEARPHPGALRVLMVPS